MKQKDPSNKKILVIRYGTIGDTIFASAFLRELRNSKKDAIIDVLVEKLSAEILSNCPYINNMHFLKKKYSDTFYYINLFKKYDTIYFLKSDRFLSICAFLARVKNRIGFDVKRNFMLTKTTPYGDDKHEIDYYLDLLKISSNTVKNVNTELWLSNSISNKIENLIQQDEKKVLIHATSRFKEKNWNSNKWAKIITFLVKQYYCKVFLVGTKNDIEYYKNILLNISINKDKIINLCDKININETMTLINNVDLVIGIDSGIIHIAAALNKTSILLNGPTSLTKWMPRSKNCRIITKNYECSPCLFKHSKKLCKNLLIGKCMDAITVDNVKDVIKNQF